MGISEATFYVWRKKYGGIGPSELRRLRQLEEENRKLKQIVADLSLDKAMLQAVLVKKTLRPSRRRDAGARADAALWRQSAQGVRSGADVTSVYRYRSRARDATAADGCASRRSPRRACTTATGECT